MPVRFEAYGGQRAPTAQPGPEKGPDLACMGAAVPQLPIRRAGCAGVRARCFYSVAVHAARRQEASQWSILATWRSRCKRRTTESLRGSFLVSDARPSGNCRGNKQAVNKAEHVDLVQPTCLLSPFRLPLVFYFFPFCPSFLIFVFVLSLLTFGSGSVLKTGWRVVRSNL